MIRNLAIAMVTTSWLLISDSNGNHNGHCKNVVEATTVERGFHRHRHSLPLKSSINYNSSSDCNHHTLTTNITLLIVSSSFCSCLLLWPFHCTWKFFYSCDGVGKWMYLHSKRIRTGLEASEGILCRRCKGSNMVTSKPPQKRSGWNYICLHFLHMLIVMKLIIMGFFSDE